MSEKRIEHIVNLSNDEMITVCGRDEASLRALEEQFTVRIVARGNQIKIIGPPKDALEASRVIDLWLSRARGGAGDGKIPPHQIQYAIHAVKQNEDADLKQAAGDFIRVPWKGRRIAAMTTGQKRYLDAMRSHDIVFGIGPAGTGKTYLAMAMAVSSLTNGAVSRIILTRPVVEAGESLGFLPGDIAQKVDPYLRPLYDALYEMLGAEKCQEFLNSGVIEVAPLAYMRGRTLNNAFIILDEAQNTTTEQMKMFLTRLGFDSKVVITGDVTQIDLPKHRESGLVQVSRILNDIPMISFIHLDENDVVRHSLVQAIIRAYDRAAAEKAAAAKAGADRARS